MNRKLLLLSFLVGALTSTTPSPAQTNAAPPSVPSAGPPAVSGARIAFAQPTFDFGKVESGQSVKHDFIFTNTGSALLEVKEVRPGCGCTAAGDWTKQVEPGKTGVIPIQFNSGGYGGPVAKGITVTCNDSEHPTVGLQLSGTIWKAIDINPLYAMFNLGPDSQTNETRVVKIVVNLDEPVTVSEPTCGNPAFRAELKTVKEGKEYELAVTDVTPLNQPSLSAVISLKTSYPKMPIMNVTAFATVQPPVAVLPAQIGLPAGPLATPIQHVVTVQNNSTNSLVLSEPTITVPGAEVQLKETQPGRQFLLTLSFPAGFQSQPGQIIEARVKSNDPRVPFIKVGVTQPPTPPGLAPAQAATPPPGTNSAATNQLGSSLSTAPSTNILVVPKRPPDGPAIQFAQTAFDFGRVESGKIVTHDFAFTNTGNQTLTITEVRSSCGCTAATNWARPVEPGKTGTIPVLFNTGGMAGLVAKTLWVSCNDSGRSNVLLQIAATVWKPIDALPDIATFMFGPDFQSNQTRTIRLVSNVDEPVTLSDPVCASQEFRAELKTVREGKEYELRVSVVPPVGPGSHVAQITLATSLPKMPVVKVTGYAIVQASLNLTPQSVVLPSPPLSETAKFDVVIQNQSTNSLVLSEPTINAQGAGINVTELEAGRRFKLTLTFPAGFEAPAGQGIEARVKSNQPQFPYVTVPVFQPGSAAAGPPAAWTDVPSAHQSL